MVKNVHASKTVDNHIPNNPIKGIAALTINMLPVSANVLLCECWASFFIDLRMKIIAIIRNNQSTIRTITISGPHRLNVSLKMMPNFADMPERFVQLPFQSGT